MHVIEILDAQILSSQPLLSTGKNPLNTQEGMKKYVSALLKKAGELVEMADEVLDQGLENNPTDSGFIELKEPRNQLFAVPTYSQQPKNNPDEKEEDDPTNFSFHTPDEGEKQFPVEQIPARLNFDEAHDIDLNVTQPPATQGKVVGGAKDENNMEEDESLLDFIRNYVSQETIEEDEFFTPDQTIGVYEKESKMSRPKRRVVLPEVVRSPYVVREVSLIYGISSHESIATNCLFSARLTETDIVFKMSHVDGPRSVLESLYPGVDIASGVIDIFTHVLNEAKKRKNIDTVNRLFCHTAMVEYKTACEKFNENMEDVLKNSLYKTIKGIDLVFFSILIGRHFILMCMNMKNCVVQLFDNILSNVTSVRERYGPLPLVMGGITKNNFVDCGVFVMRHMETFKGDVDRCGLSKEGEKQIEELKELRHKYVAKILLADCNEVKKEFECEAQEFNTLPLKERMRLENNAFKKIKARVKQMMN
ncbi:ulp1 protease family, C-terminal catalytic domain-containing protein [Tanacetum coccineum]